MNTQSKIQNPKSKISLSVPFTKMVGTGNDFIVVDARLRRLRPLTARWRAVSCALCDRRLGVGADGLLVLEPSRLAAVKMRVFNPDGSEAKMCGNGARCVARYVTSGRASQANPVTIETRAGVLAACVRGERVSMQMPDPIVHHLNLPIGIGARRFRVGVVDTGVPHAVVTADALDEVDVIRTGRALRFHRRFAPRGTNVDFVQADAARPGRLRVRTYERGVEGETPACGTGVTASAVVHALSGAVNGQSRRRRIEVEARSHDVLAVSLTVVRDGRARRVTNVVLEGAAHRVFDGTVDWSHHLSHRQRRSSRLRGRRFAAERQVVGWPLRRNP